ncbi:MAG TPA: hypothetical protein VME22_23575 [Solirubrobacteraceae bacterium]|nr:hypothetical protein [Solirubrobacteraceae bacterium]
MRRHVTLTLSALAALAAGVCAAPAAARAAMPLQNTIVINPSSGCGLLTAYTAGTGLPAWSGPAPSCGTGAFTLAFNQGNTPPSGTLSRGVGTAGSALLQAWRLTGVPDGARMGYQISAPPGITIDKVDYDDSQLQNIADGRGWTGFTYWNGGTAPVHLNGTAVDAAASGPSLDTSLNTSYWGIELRCVQSVCSWPGLIQLDQITVYASEAQGPSITPVGDPGSLWAQTGHWIWNPAGDSWALPVLADDASGLCSLSLQPGTGAPIADSSLPAANNSSWQECQQPVNWTAALDTRDYVNGAGQLPLTLQATNAAGPPTQASTSETLYVDNDPVSVSLSTPNDPNSTVWVNHAVTVDATPSTGPSGLGGMTCTDGGAAQSYPAGGLTVNGDGVRTVSCTAWNNAIDPQGNYNSGTSSVTVHIDEAPPVLSLQPVNPNDPTAVLADTSDSESGVADGSVEMAPAGTGSWTSLPTTFTGSQLLAHFNDAGLDGDYSFKVTSCDNVGNCASTTRTLMLPARAAAISRVSVETMPTSRCSGAPAKSVAAAARVRAASQGLSIVLHRGQSLLRVARDDTFRPAPTPALASISAGNVFATASAADLLGRSRHDPRAVSTALTRRSHRAAAHPGRSCNRSAPSATTQASVGYGQPVALHGVLTSSAGLPIPSQPVAILTAPDNGSNAFTQAATVTTGPDGTWTATLPPGPSRIVQASYPGSPTILPATGSATVITPATIELTRVTPDRTPWGSTVRITGRVLGGYIPASSKLLRLDLGIVGIPGLSKIQGIPNIAPDGTFTTTYKFGRYQGVVRFWLQVSSLAEADFPFSPSHSRRLIVTVGVPARRTTTTHVHHRRAHHGHRRSAVNRGLARREKHPQVHRSGPARRR